MLSLVGNAMRKTEEETTKVNDFHTLAQMVECILLTSKQGPPPQ